MAKFRVPGDEAQQVESPSLLFRDLPRDEDIKFLWAHQEKMLDEYFARHLKSPDVALELPTGSGKTLVGLLVAEYRRRRDAAAVVFLCPTRQLCRQVNEQAKRYGIPTVNLSGPHGEWAQADLYRFQQGQAVAIATYSTVFNSHPALSDVAAFICDDAHAAADFVAAQWTLEISRKQHPALYDSVIDLLRPILPANVAAAVDDIFEQDAVDLVSAIRLQDYLDRLQALIGQYVPAHKDLKYAWGEIASHVNGCNLYCSSQSIEIRPIVPPTDTHQLFKSASQRIYMSATLGEDGDLERAFGRRTIARLPIPEGWDRRGTGRRLVMQPGLNIENPKNAVLRIMQSAGRALWLSNSSSRQERAAKELRDVGFNVVGLTNRDSMTEEFIDTPSPAAMVVACRYDGIDLPGDLCRLAIVQELPRSLGLQERFLYEKLQAQAELRDRIRTRVVQAFGRCTRDETDYSLVIVLGGSLNNWLATPANTRGMHPESQAEIQFGASNSLDTTEDDFVELCTSFLNDRDTRQEVDRGVRAMRERCTKTRDPEADQLVKAARYEIEYSHLMWKDDFAGALEHAGKVIDALEGGDALRPYRGFWYHSAAVAAFLAWKATEQERYRDKCLESVRGAQASSYTLSWLSQIEATLEGALPLDHSRKEEARIRNSAVSEYLDDVKLVGSRFSQRLQEARELLSSTKAANFERGLQILGRMLGAQATRPSGKGAADGLWIFDSFAVVIEAKSDALADGTISIDTVRQAASHEKRIRADVPQLAKVPMVSLLVTPQSRLDRDAAKIAGDMCVASAADMLSLLDDSASALAEVRSAATGSVDDSLMSLIEKAYGFRGLTGAKLRERLESVALESLPI